MELRPMVLHLCAKLNEQVESLCLVGISFNYIGVGFDLENYFGKLKGHSEKYSTMLLIVNDYLDLSYDKVW